MELIFPLFGHRPNNRHNQSPTRFRYNTTGPASAKSGEKWRLPSFTIVTGRLPPSGGWRCCTIPLIGASYQGQGERLRRFVRLEYEVFLAGIDQRVASRG